MNIDTKLVNRYTGRKIPEAQWNQLCRLIRCNDNIFQDISLVSAIASAGQYFLHGVSHSQPDGTDHIDALLCVVVLQSW